VIVSVDAPDLKTSLRATGQRLAQRAKPRSETV
jgi:hypothetical protein